MRFLLGIPFARNLHRRILIEQLHRRAASFPDSALHRVTGGSAFQSGEVQILREAVIAEVALLKRRAALKNKGVAKRFHLGYAGENPGQEVVSFENLPRQAETLACFLKACTEGLHALTFPGRFS
jgi:hypothetical protein